ncbi:hypothetical protein JNB11_02295 [Kocuria palustris]|nr:hypothetical protein [Kocuria palustris]
MNVVGIKRALAPGLRFPITRIPIYRTSIVLRITPITAYSTKTAPPPPPPPAHDKDAKGKKILNYMLRAFTWSASSVIVLGGVAISAIVLSLIFSELFLPSGDTKTFNKALNIIEADEKIQKLFELKPGERLKAHGDVHAGRWVRNRPPQAVKIVGKDGVERMFMKFMVELPENKKQGIVTLEQFDKTWWSSEFAYIAVDIPGYRKYYVIEPAFMKADTPKGAGFLGLNWGPKKD